MKKEYSFISIRRLTPDGYKNFLEKVAIKGRFDLFGETYFIHSPEKGVWNITHEKSGFSAFKHRGKKSEAISYARTRIEGHGEEAMKRIIANAMKVRESITEVMD